MQYVKRSIWVGVKQLIKLLGDFLMRISTLATLLLVLVTAMWGLTFPLIHSALQFISPGTFVSVRMIVAMLVLLPFVIFRFKNINQFLLLGCVALALLNTATYIFQTKGLTTITAPRSAFITGMSVILVPLFMPLFRMGNPSKVVLLSVIVCLTGLYILTGANLHHLAIGDLFTFAAAISYALFVIVMQIMSTRVKDYLLLCFFQIAFSVPFAVPFMGATSMTLIQQPVVIISLLFCAVFATNLSIYLQGKYQQHITATKTALIFALEPVFATLFSYFINNTIITFNTLLGGALILLSILLPDSWDAMKKNKLNK